LDYVDQTTMVFAADAACPPPSTERADPTADIGRPESFYFRRLRPVADWLAASVLLVLLSPVALAVGAGNLAVFRAPRKVLFRQRRVGQDGRVFVILKFRTMREVAHDGGVDLCVTRFGRFLRNTHLDEVPQLWNVLRGEMALIGPRPEMVEIEDWAKENVPGFAQRLVIKPGLTGLAQITQGYTPVEVEAYQRKLELNRDYLARASFLTDCRILAHTLLWVVTARVAKTPNAPWNRASTTGRP